MEQLGYQTPTGGSAVSPRSRRVLFVDDDQLVLRSLARLFRNQPDNWLASFAGSGEEALGVLAADDFDVVVSDMQMPGMDGAALLGRIQELRPEVVRIVLTGHSDPRLVRRALPIAHQLIAKPFERRDLQGVLKRAGSVGGILMSPLIRRLVGTSNELPTLPSTYHELSNALADPDVSIGRVAALVQRDAGLSARLVQIASSAFFGLGSRVKDVRSAVSYLGVNVTRALVLSVGIVKLFDGVRGNILARYQLRALATALLCRDMATMANDPEVPPATAFTAGLLSEVGTLLLISRGELLGADGDLLLRNGSIGNASEEAAVLGITHAEIGAYLLGIWGIAQEVVSAVALHHDRAAAANDPLARILWLASEMIDEPTALLVTDPTSGRGIPESWVQRSGLAPHWTAVRERAIELRPQS